MSDKVDAYLAALPDWQAAALRLVRAEAQVVQAKRAVEESRAGVR